jgi:hypothetical protein
MNHPNRKAPRSTDEPQPIQGINPELIALALKMPGEMHKVIDAEDILNVARNCVECVFLAARASPRETAGPLQAVANLASEKIDEAIALLEECRNSLGCGPSPVKRAL